MASPLARVVEVYVELFVPVFAVVPFIPLISWCSPPLTGVAVKVTDVPAHIAP